MSGTLFFDAAGTLFAPRRPVAATYLEFARRQGLTVESEQDALGKVSDGFRRAFQQAEPLSAASLPESATRDGAERQWWSAIARRALAPVGLPPDFEAFFEEVYRHFATAAAWRLEPGCRRTLGGLTQEGRSLGIISNFDSRLVPLLAELELDHYFAVVVFSSAVEWAKPDPRIFQHALALCGHTAAESCHVGDRYRDDFLGATGAGLQALLYDPSNRYTGVEARRITRLEELPPLLI